LQCSAPSGSRADTRGFLQAESDDAVPDGASEAGREDAHNFTVPVPDGADAHAPELEVSGPAAMSDCMHAR